MQAYALNPSASAVINDSPERLDFHIRSGDYFSFLATVMGFVEEAITKCGSGEMSEREKEIARELRHDLRYVQANYKIVPRTGNDVQTIRPSGDLLSK